LRKAPESKFNHSESFTTITLDPANRSINRSKSTENLNDKEKDKNNDKKDKNLTLFDMQKTKRKVKSIPYDYD